MPNPAPKTEHLEPHRWRPTSDRPRGKVIGVRYPLDVEQALLQLDDHQDFIRQAVEEKLIAEGLLQPASAETQGDQVG